MNQEESSYTANPAIVALLLLSVFGAFFAIGYLLMDYARQDEREEIGRGLKRWAKAASGSVKPQEFHETPPPAPTLAPEVE